MRSVQIAASVHHSLRRSPPVASVPCLAVSGTAETSACPIPDLKHPVSCLPSLGPVLLPGLSAVNRGCGTMKALTPGRLTRPPRSLRLQRLAFPTFRPQPRELPVGRFASRLSANGSFQASPHMSRLATNSRRNRFVIPRIRGGRLCGLSVRLRLLPTPPRSCACTTQLPSTSELRHTPARTSTVLTKRPHGRTHADEGRHPRLPFVRKAKTWMLTFVSMTGNAKPASRPIRRLLPLNLWTSAWRGRPWDQPLQWHGRIGKRLTVHRLA